MPFAAGAAAAIGAIGGVATGIGSAVAAGNRKKYAEYVPPELSNYQFGPDTYDQSGARQFYGQAEEARNRQLDPYAYEQQKKLITQLQAGAEGKGPSAAQGVLGQGTDEAVKSAMAIASTARGGNLGGAQIGAVNAGSSAVQQGAQRATILAAQEQQAYQQQLAGTLGGMRAATLNEAQYRSQLEQYYTTMGASREEAALKAKTMFEAERGARQMGYQQLAADEEGQRIGGIQKGLAGAGQAFSSFGSSGGGMGGKKS